MCTYVDMYDLFYQITCLISMWDVHHNVAKYARSYVVTGDQIDNYKMICNLIYRTHGQHHMI